MYYQNGSYMQDLNYYNQNPNMGYNPYNTNQFQNPNVNMQMPMGQMYQQNLSAMYPAVYRIISPVVSQVLTNNNTGYLTDDVLNSMVDTVYNIVEGDINLNNNTNKQATQANSNSNESNCGRTSSNATPSSNSTSATNSTSNGQNNLLRDLIKIMILNEIISRRNTMNSQTIISNSMPNMMQNPNMNQPMFI